MTRIYRKNIQAHVEAGIEDLNQSYDHQLDDKNLSANEESVKEENENEKFKNVVLKPILEFKSNQIKTVFIIGLNLYLITNKRIFRISSVDMKKTM